MSGSFASLPARHLGLPNLEKASLEELGDIKKNLTKSLKTIQLPRPTSVTAIGEEIKLPRFVGKKQVETPSATMLEYLTGFFEASRLLA